MMKIISIFSYVLLLTLVACDSKNKHDHQEHKNAEEWPEMESFHMIMAETFHPYNDSSNLEPLKKNIDQLKAEAEKWAAAPLPEGVNNDEMRNNLQQLKDDANALAKLVENGNDEAIATSLKSLHANFHQIQEGWYKGKAHHESESHH